VQAGAIVTKNQSLYTDAGWELMPAAVRQAIVLSTATLFSHLFVYITKTGSGQT
jgi:hypothetical protein